MQKKNRSQISNTNWCISVQLIHLKLREHSKKWGGKIVEVTWSYVCWEIVAIICESYISLNRACIMTTPLDITVLIRETLKAPSLDEKLKQLRAGEWEKVTILLGNSSWCFFPVPFISTTHWKVKSSDSNETACVISQIRFDYEVQV